MLKASKLRRRRSGKCLVNTSQIDLSYIVNPSLHFELVYLINVSKKLPLPGIFYIQVNLMVLYIMLIHVYEVLQPGYQGAVSIRKTVLPGMAIPMLKIRRPNGRLIFNMEITIRK